MIPKDLIQKRKIQTSDENFIYSNWLSGVRRRFISRGIDHTTFNKRFSALVTKVLAVSDVDVICSAEDPDLLFGFIVYRTTGPVPIISYWYVKSGYRQNGLGKMLIDPLLGDVAVATNFDNTLGGYFERKSIVYDPFYDFEL